MANKKNEKSKIQMREEKLFNRQNLGVQYVDTPVIKIEKNTGVKFSSFITDDMKDFCVLFNTEFVRYLIKYFQSKQVNHTIYTFIDSKDDEREILRTKHMYNYENIVILNYNDYDITNENVVEKLNRYLNMKHFDIAFSNPPYASGKNVGLDIKILMSVLEVANETVFIQPSAWALRTVYKMPLQKDFIRLYGKNVEKLIFVSPKIFEDGCKKFEPLLISHINKLKTFDKILVNDSIKNINYEAASIDDVNIFALEGKWDIVKSIIKKLNSYMDEHGRCSDFIISHDKINEYSVWISLIRGNAANRYKKPGIYNHAFCSVINQDDSNKINPSTILKPRDLWIWAFKSDIERDNFINYCKTKIARFAQAIYKFDGNVNMADVPWFDFQNEISDYYAAKKLKLSEEEWNYIDTFIEK